MKIVLVIFLVHLIISQYFGKIDGAKKAKEILKKKITEVQKKAVLKKMIADMKKCAKSNKNEATKLVLHCLSDIKKQKNLLDKNDKTEKDIFKKVVTNLMKCMKSSQPSRKNKNNSKKSTNNRRKRSLKELPNEVLEQIFENLTPYQLTIMGQASCNRIKDLIFKMLDRIFNKRPWNVKKYTEIDELTEDFFTYNP